ncbi:MAG TPA: hypothetical protein VFI47_26730 [Acidimicrobiales bacterium]|nr:hypothetical protein [Acidimicrobiales bacterium]
MNLIRKGVIGGALVATTLAGGALGATLVGAAGAQDSPSQTEDDPSTSAPESRPWHDHGDVDPSKGGHVGQDGTAEELLTGEAADKAEAAAQEAVPDGTIQRVETDAEGDAYEAHMTDADGKPITVKMDEDFNVTGTEEGGHR